MVIYPIHFESLLMEQELKANIKKQFLYLPTNPEFHITDIIVDSAAAMQSAAKAPYLLMFEVEQWDGPDSAIERIERSMKERGGVVIQPRSNTCRTF